MLVLDYSYRDDTLGNVLVDLAVRFVLNCPTEDTATNERLFFQIEEAHWFYEDFARVENPALPSMKIKTFVERLFEVMPLLNSFAGGDPLQALLQFQHYKKSIPVRGGIILNERIDKVLLVRGWKGSSWGFPKGKINKNEPDEACAVREVREETGFDMTPFLRSDDYLEITRGGKNIRLYIVRGVPESTVFETQTRKEISKIEWHSINRLPVFNRKASTHYYTATPFMNGLKKYIAKAKGLASSLSSSESESLKKLLDVRGKDTVRDDKETAERLLKLIKGNSNPLIDLLKGPGSRLDAAQNALGLLRGEIATENVIQGPTEISTTQQRHKTTQAPQLPPNDMLQSLVNARRSGTARPSILRVSGSSAGSRRNGLLDLIGESTESKAKSNPKHTESSQSQSENDEGKKLLSMIKSPTSTKPERGNGEGGALDGLQDKMQPRNDGEISHSDAKSASRDNKTGNNERDSKSDEGSSLLSMIKGTGRTFANNQSNTSQDLPTHDPKDDTHESNISGDNGEIAGNKLLSLLKRPGKEPVAALPTAPIKDNTIPERNNSLLSLLQDTTLHEHEHKQKPNPLSDPGLGSTLSDHSKDVKDAKGDKDPKDESEKGADSVVPKDKNQPLEDKSSTRNAQPSSKQRQNSLLELLQDSRGQSSQLTESDSDKNSSRTAVKPQGRNEAKPGGKNELLSLLKEPSSENLQLNSVQAEEKPTLAKEASMNGSQEGKHESQIHKNNQPMLASEEKIGLLKLLDPKETDKRMPRNLPGGWTLSKDEMLHFLETRI